MERAIPPINLLLICLDFEAILIIIITMIITITMIVIITMITSSAGCPLSMP